MARALGGALSRLLVAALLAYGALLLMRVPRLGVADNGDFSRVMSPAGIQHGRPMARPGRFVEPRYRLRQADLTHRLSSAALMARVARSWTWGLDPGSGWMDLRQMGILHLLATALVMAAGLAWGMPPLLVAASSYLMMDPGYLLFFNSFYADSALLVALPAATFWLLRWGAGAEPARPRREPGPVACAALPGLALLGGASKMLYALLPGCLLAALVLPGLIRRGSRRLPGTPLIVSLLAVSLLVPAHFLWGWGPRFEWANKYHAVFAGIVKVSRQPDRALSELGISPEHRALPRRDVFSGRIAREHPVHRELEGASRLRIATLYLKEPAAVAKVAGRVQRELAARRSHLRGNFERVESRRPRFFRAPWDWSRWRSALLSAWPPLIWVFMAAAGAWLLFTVWGQGGWDGRKVATLFLLLWSLGQIPVVVLGDGLVSLRQHLLGARLGVDLLLLVLVYDGWMTARRRSGGER